MPDHSQSAHSDNALLVAYQAALTVASETRLDAVLQRLVELAREVASARYAALGVADEHGRVQQFVYSGISDEQAHTIGPFPEGHGLLGVLIHEGEPLLVSDIAEHPQSAGFPPDHPVMQSLLGVPILLDGHPVGNLYLTEREDGEAFDEDDYEAIRVLAAHAATAIQRAQLFAGLEAAGAEAEAQRDALQVIIGQLPAGVLIQSSPTNGVVLANQTARQMVYGSSTVPTEGSIEQSEGAPRFRRADGAPLPESETPTAIALRGETDRHRQLLLVPQVGPETPVFVQSAPLLEADGTVTRAVVVMQDITRLREAEQLKDDFLSLVSHEFRTPLAAIHGGASLLTDASSDLEESDRETLLRDIVRESGRLDQMLENMLRLGEVMAGRLQPETEPVLVPALIGQITRDFESRVSDARCETRLPPDLPLVEGDPALLHQVFTNLCENALKYSPRDRTVVITANTEDDRVHIHVTDRGVGIAPEHVPHVFERFRRPGADPAVRGMGLGLYLCRQLMHAQGGEIRAASPGVGQGSTFTISLPVAHGWDATDW